MASCTVRRPNNENARDPGQRRIRQFGTSYLPVARARDFRAFGVEKKAMNFVHDDKLQQIAEAYALDACDFLRDHFHVTLDWSDSSIEHLETVMDRFHREAAKARPSPEQVMQFA